MSFYKFLLLIGSLFIGTSCAQGQETPPSDNTSPTNNLNADLPKDFKITDDEMKEFTEFLKMIENDPEFQKELETFQNDPEFQKLFGTPPAATPAATPAARNTPSQGPANNPNARPSAIPSYLPPPIPTQAASKEPTFSASDSIGRIIFSDETPYQVISLLEKITGKSIIAQQNLPSAKITFDSQTALPKAEAILALESALSLNGVAIIPIGENLLKAVPTTAVNTQAPQLMTEAALLQDPSQKVYTKYFALKYLTTADILPVVKNCTTPNLSTIEPFTHLNTLMITDTALNLQRIETLLEKIDQPPNLREQVIFYSLKNISASEMQRRLRDMQEKTLKGYFLGTTVIESDDRTNQLIVITHESNVRMLQTFIDKLDVDAAPITQSHVFPIHHGEAPKILEVLQKVIDGQKIALKEARDKENKTGKKPDESATNSRAESGDSLEFSNFITVAADERTNAIVACGTRSDIKQIGHLIEKLDGRLLQVRIEVVITEVLLSDNWKRGIDAFGLSYNAPFVDSKGVALPNSPTGTNNLLMNVAGAGSTYSLVTGLIEFSMQTVFNTAENNGDVRILSSPTIVTTHNKKAMVKVVQQQPIIQQAITNTADPTFTNNSVKYEDIGITLTVTPKVARNGTVQMEINQKISSTSTSTIIGNNSQPIINLREADSFVSARDGELIVLGGLKESRMNKTDGKIAILGDIPLVGPWLFSSQTDTQSNLELVIFIIPHVLSEDEIAAEFAKESIEKSMQTGYISEYLSTGKMPIVTEVTEDISNPKAAEISIVEARFLGMPTVTTEGALEAQAHPNEAAGRDNKPPAPPAIVVP
jgi:general secretion pathway protein D